MTACMLCLGSTGVLRRQMWRQNEAQEKSARSSNELVKQVLVTVSKKSPCKIDIKINGMFSRKAFTAVHVV